MTEAKPGRNAGRFEPYFRHIADMLALKDWRIEIVEEAPEREGDLAEVECVYGRKWARIGLSDDFLEGPEDKQRHLAVHELLHAHFAHADGVAYDLIDRKSRKVYLRALEYAVDGIADGVAHGFPLPSEVLGPAPIADDTSMP